MCKEAVKYNVQSVVIVLCFAGRASILLIKLLWLAFQKFVLFTVNVGKSELTADSD